MTAPAGLPGRRVALIETVRVRDGEAPLWYLHLRRLSESCVALGMPLPRELTVPGGGEDRVHRLEVGLAGATVTTRAVGSLAPLRLMTARAAHRAYPHKTTERAAFDAAAREAEAAGADDALLLTPAGEVAECSRWALLWWEGDRLAGPPAALGVLRSVGRMRLAELAGGVLERRCARAELAGRPLVAVNAARGLVEVARLDDAAVPEHPGTAILQACFWS